MYDTQNVNFTGFSMSGADPAQLTSKSVMQAIGAGLRNINWNVSNPRPWRDFWEMKCNRDDAKLLVLIVDSDQSVDGTVQTWELQTFPLRPPAMLDRLFGIKSSASRDDIYALACDIHKILKQHNSTTQWCWNGNPTLLPSTTRPTPPYP